MRLLRNIELDKYNFIKRKGPRKIYSIGYEDLTTLIYYQDAANKFTLVVAKEDDPPMIVEKKDIESGSFQINEYPALKAGFFYLFILCVNRNMNWKNKHYRIAFWGTIITLLLQLMLTFTVDPYIAGVLSPFYSVWVIIFVVGWRKEKPRQ